jgi:hypothetical protein
MAVTNTSGKTSADTFKKIIADFPQYKFKPGPQQHWSPKTKTITFDDSEGVFGLLHELAHALLDHQTYKSDFELLQLESQAWHKAAEIGRKYGLDIDEDHIQDCLDTYRDWLHRRSACPACGVHSLQTDTRTYECFNCGKTWQVSAGRFARPYRRTT